MKAHAIQKKLTAFSVAEIAAAWGRPERVIFHLAIDEELRLAIRVPHIEEIWGTRENIVHVDGRIHSFQSMTLLPGYRYLHPDDVAKLQRDGQVNVQGYDLRPPDQCTAKQCSTKRSGAPREEIEQMVVVVQEAVLVRLEDLLITQGERERFEADVTQHPIESPASEQNPTDGNGHWLSGDDHPLSVFRSMDGLQFREIHIRVDPEKLVLRILARQKEVAVPFSTIGLTKKNEVTFSRQGEVFMALANRTFDPAMSGVDRAISRISSSLRREFDTPDPPFRGHKPAFRLSIPKDKEARRRASKRTVTYDDNRNPLAYTDATDFLKACDPHYDQDHPTYADDPVLGAGE